MEYNEDNSAQYWQQLGQFEEQQKIPHEIAKAIVKAQKNFGPALKTSSNPHFRSKYADLSACVEAVIGGLNDAGIALIQKTHSCKTGVIVETVFLHESGEAYSSGTLMVPAVKQDAQGFGSALTYARRYSLMAACGIAPEDDDGNAACEKKEQQQKVKISSITEEQIQEILELCQVAKVQAEKICAHYNVQNLEQISQTDFIKIKKQLNNKIDIQNQ